ncbi:response regulator transcription factor [Bacillus litorisediminis]|uniref:response regulator transcription factor n=1 Tax=Bacillus litorisediminis TaxID=2922713 RepID=UPI002435D29D|nr:response regulator transcription factor [Bacillus litorisediminis]
MTSISVLKEPCLKRSWLINILEKHLAGFSISAYSSSKEKELYKNVADLIIVDLDTDANHFQLVDFYKRNHKKIIVETSNVKHADLLEWFKKGLNGYFYKDMEVQEALHAIKSVLQGKTYIHPELASVLLADYVKIRTEHVSRPEGLLTKREWGILELMAKGYCNQEIAELLHISERTVKNHVSSILGKLEVPNRTKAVLLAQQMRWISI